MSFVVSFMKIKQKDHKAFLAQYRFHPAPWLYHIQFSPIWKIPYFKAVKKRWYSSMAVWHQPCSSATVRWATKPSCPPFLSANGQTIKLKLTI